MISALVDNRAVGVGQDGGARPFVGQGAQLARVSDGFALCPQRI